MIPTHIDTLSLNQYQQRAMLTKERSTSGLLYAGIAMAGEVGELCNEIKKHKRDDEMVMTVDRAHSILEEAGDVLWYVANLATEMGVSLEDLAQMNLRKLSRRYTPADGG